MNSHAKAKTSARRRASGFCLDYTCSLSLRKGRSRSQEGTKVQSRERRD